MKTAGAILHSHRMIGRSRATIERSVEAIERSAAGMERSLRLLLPRVQGGSTEGDGSEDLRERIADLLGKLPQEAPRVYAGASKGGKKCDVCGRDIMSGGMEYEAEFSGLTVRLDRNCFALWQSEVAKN